MLTWLDLADIGEIRDKISLAFLKSVTLLILKGVYIYIYYIHILFVCLILQILSEFMSWPSLTHQKGDRCSSLYRSLMLSPLAGRGQASARTSKSSEGDRF